MKTLPKRLIQQEPRGRMLRMSSRHGTAELYGKTAGEAAGRRWRAFQTKVAFFRAKCCQRRRIDYPSGTIHRGADRAVLDPKVRLRVPL